MKSEWGFDCVSCGGGASLRQWCYTHQAPHDRLEDYDGTCRIAPTCGACELAIHDRAIRSPGWLRDAARAVAFPDMMPDDLQRRVDSGEIKIRYEAQKPCATDGCILWSKHAEPCVTGEGFIAALYDKESVLRERDALRTELKAANTKLDVARQMANVIYNCKGAPEQWERGKRLLIELLGEFDAGKR